VLKSASRSFIPRLPAAMPWPLPALLVWAASWSVFIVGLRWLKMSPVLALLLAAGLAITLSFRGATRWRRIFTAWGFPLSLAASGVVGTVPPWAWLLPLALLVAFYPVTAWRDAPLFPTPSDALQGLAQLVPLRDGARIVDAGCGLGDALKALRREYPRAQLVGLEWSWPIRMACSWRLGRAAAVSRADIWSVDWSGYDLVYLFQRPESMPRAADKAGRELRPGAWLASLEFAVPELTAQRVLSCPDGRSVWLYQAPFRRS
jgi:SAM-dependent methyltransferase